MFRRKVLAGAGTVLGLFTGYMTLGDSSSSSQPSESDTESKKTETEKAHMDFGPEDPDETIEYGDPNTDSSVSKYRIVLWNDASSDRAIALSVATGDGNTVIDEQHSVPSNRTLDIILHEPDEYSISVDLPDEDRSTTVSVDRDEFDCNATATNVHILEDGTFESETVTTWLDC